MIVKHHCVYTSNNPFHILQISNFNIHELLMHFMIELLEIFNLSIKPNIRFLTKISKLSILFTAYMVLETSKCTLFGLRVGNRVRDMYIFVINLPNQSIDKLVVQLLI